MLKSFFLACIISTATLSHAHAEPAKQTMIYDVYAGGFHVVNAQLDIDLSRPKNYDISLSAKTRGFLGRLAPWQGSFESNGWALSKADYRPEIHKSIATWRDETEVKEYTYGQDRTFKSLVIKDHNKKPFSRDVKSELTHGTTDVLSATLMAMQAIAAGNGCDSTADVFDGKRRFKLKFKHQGEEDLKPTRYNIYGGASTVCIVEVEPNGGGWHEKPRGWMSIQEQGREKGTMPTVWMAQVSKGGPAVPIKVLVKTDYGALYMHLAEYRSGDNILIAEKRAEAE